MQLLGSPQRVDQLPGSEGACADIAHLAGPDQVVERAQRLIDRNLRARPVNLVQIDVVGLEALQAGLTLLDNMPPTVALRIWVVVVHRAMDFGSQNDLLTLAVALKRLASDFLAASAAIDVGGVQEVNPTADCTID